MKCKKCGFELDPTDEFCRHCGQRTIEDSNMTVCPHCGEVISKLMVFCPNCHKVAYKPDNAIAPPQIQETKSPAIVATPTSSGTSAPVKKPFYKSSAFITFIAILIILVLIIVPVVIYNFITKSAIKSDFLNHGNAKMIGDVAYYYDEEWEETTFDDYVHYTKDDPYFSFSIRIEDCISKADEYDADDYIDELDDSENYEKQSVPIKYTYNNVETYHYRNIDSTQIDEYYIFCYDDELYVFDFYISDSDKTSKVAEEFILENLYFTEPLDGSYDDYTFADDYDDYYDYNYYDDYDYDYYDDYDYSYYDEDEMEEPTTELPTEKPTEAPKPKINNDTSTRGFKAQGSGDYVATGLIVEGYGVLHVSYNGTGNFSIVSYENDEYDDLLVNNIGSYSGDVLIDHSGTFSIEINADEGNWNITSSGLTVDDTTSFSGSGDAVTGITSHSGGAWHITNNGSSNFSVIQYGLDSGYMDLLVNEIGNYDGTVMSESGDNIFFKVHSNGNWSIKKK